MKHSRKEFWLRREIFGQLHETYRVHYSRNVDRGYISMFDTISSNTIRGIK